MQKVMLKHLNVAQFLAIPIMSHLMKKWKYLCKMILEKRVSSIVLLSAKYASNKRIAALMIAHIYLISIIFIKRAQW